MTTYTADENDRFQSFTQHSDERQQEQRPLAPTPLTLVLSRFCRADGLALRLVECSGQLETPLDAGPVHLEEGDAHEVDDDGCDEGEYAFPDLLGLGPEVGELGVELTH